MTSAQAAKELRKLREQHQALLMTEKKACTFVAAVQENVEDARPPYNYVDVQAELTRIEDQIRSLKHKINLFNVRQEVPGTGMTIDQVLVKIPQMTARKEKLDKMRKKLPKERMEASFGRSGAIIEYSYPNYDLEAVEADYQKAADELAALQTALDTVNSTVEMPHPLLASTEGCDMP